MGGSGRLASYSAGSGKHSRVIDEKACLRAVGGKGLSVNLNGAIYILAADELGQDNWVEGAKGFEMSLEEGIDIDDAADWQRACELMENK